MTDSPKIFYRYEARRFSVCVDPDADRYEVSSPKLELYEYQMHSETKCGWWVGLWGFKEHWISKTSRKKYAYPSKEEALDGFVEKKKAFVRHSETRLRRASEDLALGLSAMASHAGEAE